MDSDLSTSGTTQAYPSVVRYVRGLVAYAQGSLDNIVVAREYDHPRAREFWRAVRCISDKGQSWSIPPLSRRNQETNNTRANDDAGNVERCQLVGLEFSRRMGDRTG